MERFIEPRSLIFVLLLIAIPLVAYATEEAYRDCVAFYGVPTDHPKRGEVERTCRKVTKTMAEWKALKRALCATTPQDQKCKEFRAK